MQTLQLIVRALVNTTVYGLLLFVPAQTLVWWRAWVVLGLVFTAMIVTRLWLLRDHAGLLAERRLAPIQRGQPFADKLLVVAFLLVFPAYLIFIPLDVFRFHLFAKTADLVSFGGLLVFIGGCCVIALAFRENTFAAGIVKLQGDRGQTVVDSGIYSVIRHPLYSGVVLLIVGLALWLQSYAAAILSIIPIVVLIVRIVVEETFLKVKLAGYDAYMLRVRSRLVPRIW